MGLINDVKKAIADYKSGTCPGMMNEMNAVKNLYQQVGWNDEVRRACVKGGHQRCLPNARIDDAVIALRQFNITNNYTDFEELYDAVEKLLGGIPRVCGRLTLYDTARRLGHLLQPPVYPSKYVYISRGALNGAKYVLSPSKIKDDVFRLPISDFLPLFSGITSMEIEDILCIYFHEGKLRDDLPKGCGKKPIRKVGC